MLSEPCSSAVINAKGDLLVSYRHFAWRFSATLSRSSSKAKVTGKSSQPQEKNVAKLVGATSREGFLGNTTDLRFQSSV